MSCFCKITDYFEGSLFLQFYESPSEDMFWPPPPYVLSLRRMRGQKNDFEGFISLCFREERLSALQIN